MELNINFQEFEVQVLVVIVCAEKKCEVLLYIKI